jgi:hypothetical protein
MRRTAFLSALVFLVALPAQGGDHVRVVLDVSRSMSGNDPGRLALLSTALLLDLANPNTTRGDDSFVVLPFDQAWAWSNPEAPVPVSRRSPLPFDSRRREDFLRQLSELPYDAAMTYFLPGLEAALSDLERAAKAGDRKVIVLVTDGVPEKPTRDREAELFRQRVIPDLEQLGARLYVLAFGPEAASNRGFFDGLVRGSGGANLGAVFVDPDGQELLRHMAALFGTSFGYSPDPPLPVSATSSLDLHGGKEPERVAVVVTQPGPAAAPDLGLGPPPGGVLNAPDGLRRARQTGASFALQWVLAPSPGRHSFSTSATIGSVAVLRPSAVTLSLLPTPPHLQVVRTVAETPFPLKVLVQSKAGGGDPGPVQLSFRIAGERALREQPPFSWVGNPQAPVAGLGAASTNGRVYDIVTKFPPNKNGRRELYPGHLELTAQRGAAIVGTLSGQHAHRIEVYPFLALAPLPSAANARDSALRRFETGCTEFQLTLDGGELPHPERPRYSLRATLDESIRFEGELHGAGVTLDGLSLEVEKQPAPEPGPWYRGRELDREQLLGKRRVCIQLGKPTQGDPARPLELPVRFSLLEVPYDDFPVVKPFTLRVLVAPPGFWQRWGTLLLLGSALLSLLALAWYLRAKPDFPADLGFTLVREGSTQERAFQPLPDVTLARRLLGVVGERPLRDGLRDRTLGWLRPVDRELFQLRLPRGAQIEAVEPGGPVPLEGRRATLSAHRVYRVRTQEGAFLLRVEYR